MRALAVVAANAAGWAAVQLGLARIFVLMDRRRFSDLPLYRTGEAEVRVYRALGIRRWKGWLPDGAVWVGSGFRKQLRGRGNVEVLGEFEIETRRAELAHWAMLSTLPLFFACDPRRAWPVLAAYAVLSNLPCIVAQRYNRHTLRRLIAWRNKVRA